MPGVTEEQDQAKLSVCIIGAGFSGICAAIKLQRDVGLHDFEIYEMSEDLGGTWYSNRYPGCECDIPIHGYCFSFEKRANWRAQYATAKEILAYQKELGVKYDLYSRTRFRHAVQRLEWLPHAAQWKVTIRDLEQGLTFIHNYDVVISATGSIRVPKIPEEFRGFKGPILHTAQWDSKVELSGKRVAVVGTGASGIQVIPEVSKVASHLYVFQRKPSWILPKYNWSFGGFIQWLFTLPGILLIYNLILFHTFEIIWHGMKRNSLVHKIMSGMCNWHRSRQLGDRQDLYDALSPKYPWGCQRTGFASNYFPVFQKDTTTLVTSHIESVNAKSITTKDGQQHPIDVLVLATGFRITDYFSPMEVYDKNGGNVLTEWRKDSPSLYLGIASHKLPNLFVIYGPNTSTGHSSVVTTVEMQMDFVAGALKEKIGRKARTLCIKEELVHEYMEELRRMIEGMVWSASLCSPWYTDEEGRNVAIFPWNLQNYRKRVNTFDHSRLLEFDADLA